MKLLGFDFGHIARGYQISVLVRFSDTRYLISVLCWPDKQYQYQYVCIPHKGDGGKEWTAQACVCTSLPICG